MNQNPITPVEPAAAADVLRARGGNARLSTVVKVLGLDPKHPQDRLGVLSALNASPNAVRSFHRSRRNDPTWVYIDPADIEREQRREEERAELLAKVMERLEHHPQCSPRDNFDAHRRSWVFRSNDTDHPFYVTAGAKTVTIEIGRQSLRCTLDNMIDALMAYANYRATLQTLGVE